MIGSPTEPRMRSDCQVVVARMRGRGAFGGLDQRTDRRRRGVEDADLVILDHLPEAAGVRIGRHALEDDLGGAAGERAVGDVGVAGHPADVGGTPEDIVRLDVEGPLHGQDGMQQVAAGAVLDALRLAGRTGGVEQEQRMLGIDPLGLAGLGLVGDDFVLPDVAAGDHVAGAAGALEDDDGLDLMAGRPGSSASSTAGFRGMFLPPRHCSSAVMTATAPASRMRSSQRLGGEAAEHHRVDGADAGAGLHGDDAFDRHRHVDQDAVALLDALRLAARWRTWQPWPAVPCRSPW